MVIYWWLSHNYMAKICDRKGCLMVEILGRTRIVFKIEEIGSKEDIKIVQKQQVAHIGNKTKRNLEMTPWKRELEECRLKVAKMHIIKRIE